MRTEHKLGLSGMGLVLLLASCATTSAHRDYGTVGTLSRSALPAGAENDLRGATASDARALLAQPLSADGAVRIAMLNNRELRATLRELGVSRGLMVQAGLLPNPRIELDLRRPTDRTLPLQKEVMVEYDLTDAILAPMRAHAARADLEAHRLRVAAEVVRFGYSVRETVYAAQAAQGRWNVATRMLDAYAASRDAARAFHEAGNITEADLATQEATYESARATAAELELDVIRERERLNQVLGLHGADTLWKLAPLSGLPAVAELSSDVERRAVQASLELQAVKSRARGAQRRADLYRTQGILPDISVDVHGEQDESQWEYGGGLSFTVPIFDRKQGLVSAQEADFDAQIERAHALGTNIRSSARHLHARVLSLRQRAEQYEHVIVPARSRVLEQNLHQYNAMQIGVFPLLQALRERQDAEIARIDSVRQYLTARAALDALLQGVRVSEPASATAQLSSATAAEGGH
ncbi:MAG TPA: TolC family protein [Polyangiaceae bacterium]